MNKSLFLLVFLFGLALFATAQKQKETVVTEEYTVYYSVPKDSEFRAKESYDITITSEIRFTNGEKLKWELFYNVTENKPRAIEFACAKSMDIDKFVAYLNIITKGDFWKSITNCLPTDIFETTICINNLPEFQKLACLVYTGEDCTEPKK